MDTIFNHITSPQVTLVGAIFKLLLSMLLGAVIGFERRRKGQFAGLRTFALIAMGATLAMLISIYIPQVYMGLKNGDPGRIAAQVVSGVGFLGAGGLTTAAGIWMAACIGLAVGAGMYGVAIVATLLIIFILLYMERFEQRANLQWESKVVRLKVNGIIVDLSACREKFAHYDVKATSEYMKYDYENTTTVINFVVLTKDTIDMPVLFNELSACFESPLSITLTNEPNL